MKRIVFSRDEYKQHILKKKNLNNKNYKKLRFFLGDIRDKDRLIRVHNNQNILIVIVILILRLIKNSYKRFFKMIKLFFKK